MIENGLITVRMFPWMLEALVDFLEDTVAEPTCWPPSELPDILACIKQEARGTARKLLADRYMRQVQRDRDLLARLRAETNA